MRLRELLGAVAIALVMPACAGEAAPPQAVEVILGLWNRSQFELLEVRVHASPDALGAENLLAEPLAREATVELAFTSTYYVTVVRKKVDVGDAIALTTAEPVIAETDGFTLVVFDEAFRLLSPSDPR